MEKIQKYKFLAVLLFMVLFTTSLFLSRDFANETLTAELLKEIAPLNTEYKLIEAVPLNKEPTKYLASIFHTRAFEANVMEADKPKKSIIIKIKSQDPNGETLSNILVLKLQTEEDVNKIAEQYSSLRGIQYAEPDYKIYAEPVATSKLTLSSEKEIIEYKEESNEIIIGLVDSGADTNHPDLEDRFVDGWDFINDQQEVDDEVGHGTHVAGIIAKNSEHSKIMPIKFTDKNSGKLSTLVRSIKFAVDNEVEVINISAGLKTESSTLKEAIEYADEKGIIIVAAAGNYNTTDLYYPAAWPEVVSVAAVNDEGEKTFISNYGDWVDFSAPGEDILSTTKGGEYEYRTGTSQATPVVTAEIADILYEMGSTENLIEEIFSELEEISASPKGKYESQLGQLIAPS